MSAYDVLGIVAGAIVFAIAVATPVLRLNATVTKLLGAVDVLNKGVDALTADNKAAHARLWARSDEHGAQLAEHNSRISVLEHRNN